MINISNEELTQMIKEEIKKQVTKVMSRKEIERCINTTVGEHIALFEINVVADEVLKNNKFKEQLVDKVCSKMIDIFRYNLSRDEEDY